jgi:FMN-dependent NADH-azoreductase
MNILAVQSGIFGEHSNSTQLVNQVVSKLSTSDDSAHVTVRDLTSKALPYFDSHVAMALGTEEAQRTEAQKAVVALSDELINEVVQADVIVIGVPMYNFGVPAQMKSWFDYLARAGVTFKYTETGPVGLLKDKPVYVAAARGGMHAGQASDSQTPFVRTILGFLGLKDVRIAYAEGLAMGDDAKSDSFNKFDVEVAELV